MAIAGVVATARAVRSTGDRPGRMPVPRQHPVGEDASGATVPVSERADAQPGGVVGGDGLNRQSPRYASREAVAADASGIAASRRVRALCNVVSNALRRAATKRGGEPVKGLNSTM